MPLNLSTVKRQIQDHLEEGLMLVVGSGLSLAEGIPGMGQLATHLKKVVPSRIIAKPDSGWGSVVRELDTGNHLEGALAKTTLLPNTVDIIIEETAVFIRAAETVVIKEVTAGRKELAFTAFAKHLFKAGKRFHLLTPNYDRLIEFATEAAGIGVDTRFVGALYGHPEPRLSGEMFREPYVNGRTVGLRHIPHLCIYKPHGSLDWFNVYGKILRCPIDLDIAPLIITPGASKYRESFRWAFDDQRSAGNLEMARAKRFMFIGYGFNDEHLEQHACPDLTFTRDTIILARSLSDNAKRAVQNSFGVSVLALSTVSKTDDRTLITSSSGESIVVNEPLWNLNGFNKEIL
jgi:SIR2-like domain